MKGSWIGGGIAVITLAVGGGMYYANEYAYFSELPAVDTVEIAGVSHAVSDYRAIGHERIPTKLRACFTLDDPTALAEAPEAPKAAPFRAPGWFDCWDATVLSADVASGAARTILAADNESDYFARYVAVYPDGRAFMWRQAPEE